MDTPLNPQDPTNTPVPTPAPVSTSGAGHVDLDKILLPKKEEPGHTVDSAQRVNAGALLEQEVAAAAEGTHEHQSLEKIPVITPSPKPAPAPNADEPLVRPLETFQRDIESVVQDGNVSVLSIAAAEANRRSSQGLGGGEESVKESKSSLVRNIFLIIGGLVFLVAASGALAYLVTRPTSVPVATDQTPTTPFINVDAVKNITITPDETRDTVMANLDAARQATSLSLGLMSQLLVTESSSTPSGETTAPLDAQDFFTLIAPNIPAELARSFEPNYLLGVHVYNGNQAFVILSVYSYEEAYAGMLAWEPYLQEDLAPLFSYTPSPHIPEEGITTTAATTSNQLIQTGFVDAIVENHDARVLENSSGDIYLLWTFLDSSTLVITTNDATLREIISRLKEAPITPIPTDTTPTAQ
jgi:hypothetical protein